MKLDLEQLKTLAESGDKASVEAYIYKAFEKEDVPLVQSVNADVRSVIDAEKDKHHNKALETWKTNNLESLVEAEVKKRNPDKTPEQLELEKLRKEIEDERNARNREALKNKALEVASEKGLPKGVLDFFIAEDEEKTLANLTTLEQEVQAAIQAGVEAKFKQNGRNPLGGAGNGKDKAGAIGKELAGASGSNDKQVAAEKHYFGE
ncbi:DUF4355 domain-containing protein [Sporosarcina contaminans]|uniref:DUF4355 domain-containing protein n=1 Tax=Sporosarcina contaminans TaxID=633403 RepID=A0ABW3U3H7_9BACL